MGRSNPVMTQRKECLKDFGGPVGRLLHGVRAK